MAKVIVSVSLPKDATPLPGNEGILGQLTVKKNKATGQEIKTKKGGKVYNFAFNLTRFKKMIATYPRLVQKDKKTDDDIVWLVGFEQPEAGVSW